ncbi:MAG: YdcF family protein [Candidatus Scalindua sp. AMX11]|nr:MAG: YdcF family protein [Candidatus Scalindua sp.]NOG82239.1 YdcF family protein [Planctomycetota bacterium]RZV71469.1 MAG: YdcF family protein [Candidatus Scalindua sp. SCAELEC01]TDE64267.1 MAG: YdcF family protein [Candidatus Scalindua sp. AMX11]GJQ59905.1 MAG: hypothetical protein SCALA701_27060 [Candidatus Scalindua sp.]
MKSKKVEKFVIGISLSINLFLIVILFTPLTEQLYKPLIVNEEPGKSEVIVILSAGIYDDGLPDFSTLVRLRKGLELYRNKHAGTIICAGGIKPDSKDISIADVMKRTLILYGIPDGDILTQDETVNTYNDITYLLGKFESKFNFDKSIFVTSSYHTYRTRKILKKKGINACVVSANPYELEPLSRLERLSLFKLIMREYMALCYFKIQGWV